MTDFFANRSRSRVSVLTISIAVAALGLAGCSASKTKKGAAIGGATGAAIGALIGKNSDDSGKGAVIGGAAGAVVGGVIGHYMDQQADELAKIDGAKTERVGDEIKVTFDSAILFDFDSAQLKVDSRDHITEMANVLINYPDTDLIITGHTDAQGSEDYNRKLSERRATSVRNYFVELGVTPSRLETIGLGELRPVADNDDDASRKQNRRVEIEIRANEDLKARAAEEEGEG